MNTQQPSWTERLSTVGVVALLLGCLGLQVYAINKGFDITDEGYNVQLLRSRFVGTSNTYFFEVYRLLFGWLPQNVFTFRLVNTLLLVVSNGLLVTGAFKYFTIPFKPLYISFALLGIPLSVSLDPVTFSYNYATAVFTLTAVGLFLWAAASGFGKKQNIFLFISGLCTSMVLMSKVTSGLALVALLGTLTLLLFSKKWRAFGWFMLGWMFYQSTHALVATPFWVQLQLMLNASSIFTQMDSHYSGWNMINEAWLFTRSQLELVLIFGLGWLAYRYTPANFRVIPLAATAAYAWYLFSISPYQFTGYIAVLFTAFCAAMALVLHSQWKTITASQLKDGLMLMLLWIAPLCVSLGTNNHYNYNYMFAATPLLILGTVWLHRNRLQLLHFAPVLLLLMSVGVGYVCYTQILFQPYRILPLAQQTETIPEMPVLNHIKADTFTVQRFSQLKQTMRKHGFVSGAPVICLGKMQGLLSVLETSSPGGVMFSPVFKELYLHNLAADTFTYTQPYYIISDAPLHSGLSMYTTDNWGVRLTTLLSIKLNHQVQWVAVDSVTFENTPMGRLYVYESR
jgi:hypothetical protein